MSNYLAVATVTATLGRIVSEALDRVPDPSGIPKVRFGPPQADPQRIGCTIFLYRTTINAFLRNDDLPTRDDGGQFVKRPRVTVDADYLMTFAGDETTLEAQRFLGAVVSTLHAQPFLSQDAVRRTISGTSYLRASDFDPQTKVRLVPLAIDHQLIAQLWSTFPQVPYNVSVLYTATSIPIDADVALVPQREVTQVVGRVVPR
jgi:hypothetical protein